MLDSANLSSTTRGCKIYSKLSCFSYILILIDEKAVCQCSQRRICW